MGRTRPMEGQTITMGDSETLSRRVEIGRRLREARRRRGLSQSEVSQTAGITQASLSNYETGKRELPLSTMMNLAAALDVPLGDLMEISDVIILRDSRLADAVRALTESPELLESVINGEPVAVP
ncbi:MAG: helix-turn-helix transcriptional regulator [Chloroflexi bacterium]|nr:helix-turn-helix transcriptional regulator [Chloroflexota bacterium]MXZ63558.1 helix-turn-helix transcriptional regulator [Chloroflexota bacterium]